MTASTQHPVSTNITSMNTQIHIDTLLERYLSLLDEYTTLRETLNNLQRTIYQDIARANFSAERGVRYGADHYDERMQAIRRVEIQPGKDAGSPGDGSEFSTRIVVKNISPAVSAEKKEEEDGQNSNGHDKQEQDDKPTAEEKESAQDDDGNKAGNGKENEIREGEDEDPESENEKSSSKDNTKNKNNKNDPLRWFGLLTPLPLRQAQAHSIKAVEEIIPRLASVNMAMAEVELEVRRARKKRAKAAAAAEKAEGR